MSRPRVGWLSAVTSLRSQTAAIAIAAAMLLTGCVNAATVNCFEVPGDICQRAVSTARSLSPYPWTDVREVRVRWGRCPWWSGCPPPAAETHDAITVDLFAAEGDPDAYISIDREDGGWSAACWLTIAEEDSIRSEPCR
jgi:hypothetical protein